MDPVQDNFTAKDLIDSYYCRFENQHVTKVYFKLLIPNACVGNLVGNHGDRIRSIGADHRVYVSVEKFKHYREYRSCLRILRINGEPVRCVAACMNCVDILMKDLKVDGDLTQKLSLDFILPDVLIQYMEEGGNKQDRQDIFQSMAKETNTDILVSEKHLPYSTERVVRISVQSSKQSTRLQQAVHLMADQLYENITLLMCSPYNSFYALKEPGQVLFQEQLNALFDDDCKSHCFCQ